MSTYKIKVVTDNADWFSLTLEDDASWVLPLTLDGKQGPKVSIAFISLSTQELNGGRHPHRWRPFLSAGT